MNDMETVDVGTAWSAPEIVDSSKTTAIVATNAYSLLQLAIEKDIDAERIAQFMDLQDRMERKEAMAYYQAAMNRCQRKMPIVVKDKENESTKSWFARLETVAKVVKPIYTAEGFTLEFGEEDSPIENHRRIVCEVTHEKGGSKKFHLDSPIDDVGAKGTPTKTKVQGLGSMVSFLRRYLTLMIFNIITADEDNDGQQTSGLMTEEQCAFLRMQMKTCEELKSPIREGSFIQWLAEEQKDRENVHVIEDVQSRFYQKAKSALEKKIAEARARSESRS